MPGATHQAVPAFCLVFLADFGGRVSDFGSGWNVVTLEGSVLEKR